MWTPKKFKLGDPVVFVAEGDSRPIPGTITDEPKTAAGSYTITFDVPDREFGRLERCHESDLAKPEDAERIAWLTGGRNEKSAGAGR